MQRKPNAFSVRGLLLILLGWFSLALGTVGIFLPLLPTVPLWLLSAWCFAKSSPKLHNWLHNHPKFGPVIQAWQNNEGIPRKIKVRAILTIWCSLILSMAIIGKYWSIFLLGSIGLGVSFYLARQPEPRLQQDDLQG